MITIKNISLGMIFAICVKLVIAGINPAEAFLSVALVCFLGFKEYLDSNSTDVKKQLLELTKNLNAAVSAIDEIAGEVESIKGKTSAMALSSGIRNKASGV